MPHTKKHTTTVPTESPVKKRGRPPKNGGPPAVAGSTPSGAPASLTTVQQLGSIIKSARDIMRKDKGLNGDLDRLPMLTWIMFLKFLDDLERMEEDKAALAGRRYQPFISAPYRWRDWAAPDEGITGDALIAFVNQEEATLPGSTKRGKGLFTYLRSLRSPSDQPDRRDTIARVFEGTVNRMIDGYLLRDVVNKINGIHFNATEEIHTLSRLYEGMLKEMRDAAGDSGEFYTPRPVVRLMVELTNPRLGETILDPAAGTGGFLVEAFSHLSKQVKTVQDKETLQRRSIFGGEPKPLPYLLCQMNLLLHGLEAPDISKSNSLAVNIKHLTDRDRVDVILTNPPFGGQEERSILHNFPPDLQTTETSLLFVQLILRKLAHGSGRAAIVVPDGFLSNLGVAAKIKQKMLEDANLHTIVRLPFGVFEPYTPIKTNLLFFDRGAPTSSVWFFEVPIVDGRKKYTKTKPLLFDEFTELLSWWNNREPSDCAWRVSRADIAAKEYSLDFRNPRRITDDLPTDPVALADVLVAEAARLNNAAKAIREIAAEWGGL